MTTTTLRSPNLTGTTRGSSEEMTMTGEMQLTFGPEIDKLAAALVAFQGQTGAVGKGSTAKVEKDGRLLYTYNYADLASVLEATREARAAAGLAVVQFPTGDGNGITLFTTV